MVSLRPLLTPAVKETRLGSALFEAIQTTMRNTLCTLEMLANTYWRDRQSHFLMQSTPELRACQQATEALMSELALMLKSGELQGSELAISRLQEAAGRVRIDAGGEAAISGYLWLNLQLTEQLTHLRRLLGLVMHPPRSQSHP